jgi:hypothetical protein
LEMHCCTNGYNKLQQATTTYPSIAEKIPTYLVFVGRKHGLRATIKILNYTLVFMVARNGKEG